MILLTENWHWSLFNRPITLIKSIMYNPDKRFAQKRVTLCPVDNAIKKLYYWFSQYLLAR